MSRRRIGQLGVGFVLWYLSLAPVKCFSKGYSPTDDWHKVPNAPIAVEEGSPLDLSNLADVSGPVSAPVEQHPEGYFHVKGVRRKFLCAPMDFTPPYGGFPEKKLADAYSLQISRAGYNVARILSVEATLMGKSTKDFSYDKEQVDRFHYLLFALKQKGIYWMLDLLASDNASYGDVRPHRWVEKHRIKERLFFEEEAFQHWARQAEELLSTRSRYTGLSLASDPALLGVSVVNEGSLYFLSRLKNRIPQAALPELSSWLKKRYPDRSEFESVWGQSADELDRRRLKIPDHKRHLRGLLDLLKFYDEVQARTASRMISHVRGLGYKGPITGYNSGFGLHPSWSRRVFPWVDVHSYHDEAFGIGTRVKLENSSAFGDQLGFLSRIALSRIKGKPFSISEYAIPYWNEWRHQMVAVPAMAAYQGWSLICQHASTPVDFSYESPYPWRRQLRPYSVGTDPVARAVETAAFFLFRRGDVSLGRNPLTILAPLPPKDGIHSIWGPPRQFRSLPYSRRIEISWDDLTAAPKDRMEVVRLTEEGVFEAKLKDWGGRLISNFGTDAILSDTEQLKYNFPAGEMEVITNRSVGGVFSSGSPARVLGPIKLLSLNAPAMFFAFALDASSLEESKKILIVAISDALSDGVQFDSNARKQLVAEGNLPPRLRPLSIDFILSRRHRSAKLKLTPLLPSGKSILPGAYMARENSPIRINNQHGSFYWLLTAEDEKAK